MPTYTVTVRRTMRDDFTIEADSEEEAAASADEQFCELHGEHEYDHTETTVEEAAD